jgi:C4-dicarboxylate transporter, DctM subunit
MDIGTVGIIGMVLFIVLMFLNMPLGVILAVVGFVGVGLIRGWEAGFSLLSVQAYRTGSDYILGVVPLFVAMGYMAMRFKLSTDLFNVTNKWIGHLRGGIAMAATAACTIFGAICGSNVATSMAIGTIAMPEMRKYKYDDTLSTGIIASAGNLGALIPPSLNFIIYAIITEQSVGLLFISGILPGLLQAALFVFTIWIWVKLRPNAAQVSAKSSWKERFFSLKDIISTVLLILLVLGGIYAGLFTPTEAAAVGVFGVIVIGFAFRRVTWPAFWESIKETALLNGKLFVLIIGAMIFTRFVTVTEIPLHISQWIAGLDVAPVFILIVLMLFYIAIGFVLDIMPVILITAPVLHPVLVNLGYDPLWISVLVVMTTLIGGLTPPVGMTVFAMAAMIKDVPIVKMFKGVIPFVAAMVVCMIIIMIFPKIVTILPEIMKPGG